MQIEVSRDAISNAPVTISVLESLRESARLISTHYSTQIEGNRLTKKEVEDVVHNGSVFPNRQRDEEEVKNYYLAIDYVDSLIKNKSSITEENIRTIHGLVMNGKKSASKYRDGQNVIKDSATGGIVYMPPEARDVGGLMTELVNWINNSINDREVPSPIIAAIAHYEFATIHPYYDGNGRTARLITNLILHLSGYGLKGIYSLEEYYARNLQSYYNALDVGESHNYYMGRAEADISKWIEYFCLGMDEAFNKVKIQTLEAKDDKATDKSELLRLLDKRQKLVLNLFKESKFITTREISELLNIHIRTSLNLCKKWQGEGFIIMHGNAPKLRKYELSDQWSAALK